MKKLLFSTALLISLSSFAASANSKLQKNEEIVYNNQGEFVGTSLNWDFDKLPKDAIQTITSSYLFPEYQLKECVAFRDASGEVRFVVSLSGAKDRVILDISTDGEVSVFSKIRK